MRPKTAQSFHPHERTQTTTTGYIYILPNPSFPQYGKLGYATDVKQRLAELNRSTAVPFAFRVYATYEVDSALSDKKLHPILGKLNPDLRSAEEVDGKRRIREFYAMPPEDAYAILEAIAEINGFHHRLKKWKVTTTAQRTRRWPGRWLPGPARAWDIWCFSSAGPLACTPPSKQRPGCGSPCLP